MFVKTPITELTLPSGIVDKAGQRRIMEVLEGYTSCRLPDDWDWAARVGGKGEYVGTLAKRIAKYMYKQGSKLPSDCLGAVGSLVGEHTPKASTYWYDITDNFDWVAGDFGDHGSCFFGGCRDSARESMLEHGALSLRLYEGSGGEGIGRAWIMPHRSEWTIEAHESDSTPSGEGWVMFNVYGPVAYPVCARILSAIAGVSYRNVSLRNEGCRDGHIWINGSGYLIGAEENIAGVHSVDMQTPGGEKCADCSEEMDGEGIYIESMGMICESCAENYFHCSCCDEMHHHDCENEVFRDGCEEYVCDTCRDDHFSRCNDCGRYHHDHDVEECNGNPVCLKCRTESGDYVNCEHCCTWMHIDYSACVDDQWLCEDCAGDYTQCDCCGENSTGEPVKRLDGKDYCEECHKTHCATCEDSGKGHEDIKGNYYCSDCATEAHRLCYPLLPAIVTD